jgi:hypothetical protein
VLRDKRVVGPGESAKVSVEEGAQLLKTPRIVDAAKAHPAATEEADALKKRIKDLESENAGLKKGKEPKEPKPAKLKKGSEVITPAGDKGVIVKMHPGKKGAGDDAADVKLENGNTSKFALADLKPAPAPAAPSEPAA